ncbi:hypothetical protein BGAL_1590g00010 [Botrytis galanthina]|uniref:Uncharacterized protein n=1 Tax=Botrytis galanthina TaxID=278940 RepID=A0A4S8QIR8_9HELO|nr:hypothetical protein BGAL_1590g00010 [Botrytis galanthina]
MTQERYPEETGSNYYRVVGWGNNLSFILGNSSHDEGAGGLLLPLSLVINTVAATSASKKKGRL